MTASGPIVVALGGNAITRPGDEGNIEQQFASTAQSARYIADLVQAGHTLLVTHGNGPQVGAVLRRVELAARELYRLPLYVCGADTQGGMGFMISLCLNNELEARGVPRRFAALVTTVEVDAHDPAFRNPTKPIGGFYSRERAEQFQRESGWRMVYVPQHGYRRVVPSPPPRRIVEIELIRRLAEAGELLIAGGGGGVPVMRSADGRLAGVDAVIDKDRTSALLAAEIGASTLLIVTGVPAVALHFGTATQRWLDRLSLEDARRLHAEKQFPAGSMGPKIEAAIDFLTASTRPDARVLICDIERMGDALAGKGGTQIAG